jgi:hypothetical protein
MENSTKKGKSRRFSGLLLFLAIYIGGGFFLDRYSIWEQGSAEPVPRFFTVIVYHKARDVLQELNYAEVDNLMRKPEAQKNAYSFLLPLDAANTHALASSDSYFEVQDISSQEQIITFHYQLGMLNHVWSKYRATDTTVEPLAGLGSGGAYMMSFVAALGILMALAVIRMLLGITTALRKRLS